MSRTRHRAHGAGRNGLRGEEPKLAGGVCPHPEKAGYTTKRRAKRTLRRMTAVVGRDSIHVYRCTGCRLFHLGHKPGSRKTRQPQPRPAA